MFGMSFNIVKVWGIPIRIHISMLLLMGFLGVSSFLEGDFLPVVIIELMLILSIALHELGHSYFALRYGCRVRKITLTFLGGIAEMARIPTIPREEFIMAAAGPAVSAILGGLFIVLGQYVPLWGRVFLFDSSLFPSIHIRCTIFEYIGYINLVLCIFNLVPAFPMDGGRIFRSLLVASKGRVEATRQAARLGQSAVWILGFYLLFIKHGPMESSDWIHLAIALFISRAAKQELLQVITEAGGSQSSWPFGRRPSSVDQVIIGPAPYEKGPGSESDIYRGR